MKKLYFILFLMILQIKCFAVTVETTENINVYYPEYSRIDLVCGQMPKAEQKNVELCYKAAFTGELLDILEGTLSDEEIQKKFPGIRIGRK